MAGEATVAPSSRLPLDRPSSAQMAASGPAPRRRWPRPATGRPPAPVRLPPIGRDRAVLRGHVHPAGCGYGSVMEPSSSTVHPGFQEISHAWPSGSTKIPE